MDAQHIVRFSDLYSVPSCCPSSSPSMEAGEDAESCTPAFLTQADKMAYVVEDKLTFSNQFLLNGGQVNPSDFLFPA